MVQVTVKISSSLREVVGKHSLVLTVSANSSLGDVLRQWLLQFDELLNQRDGFKEVQDLMKYFIILLNGTHVAKIERLDGRVNEGDLLEIMEIVSGG